MELSDNEQRRARNLIWNAAGDYGFEPDFKAYDEAGQADLYWNSVIGAVRRAYGAETFAPLFAAFEGCLDEHIYEQLLWLGLENAVFQRESACRPALPILRRQYAHQVLALSRAAQNDRLLDVLQEAHYRRALGETPTLKPRDAELLDALEFPGDLDGPALVDRALGFLKDYFDFVPGETQAAEAETLRKKRRIFFLRRQPGRVDLPAVRGFGYGFGQHGFSTGGSEDDAMPRHALTWSGLTAPDQDSLREYIATYFGAPLYDRRETETRESALCTGEHQGCLLYYAKGGAELDRVASGYAGAQRRAALKQMEKNQAHYQADLTRNRTSVARLTARIRNALLAYLQPITLRSAAGRLDAGRVWRGVHLDDDKVFTRTLQTDPGNLCVDLLLDGSTSQISRQEVVAAQGYMIAEALTRCGIPVRVTAFCSMSGYTILTRFRDYRETDANRRIFHYFTTGCNRDGLALRALGREMEDAPCEHRMVILLSDAKPNDVRKLTRDGALVEYRDQAGVANTAAEVRALLHRDISVVCVFTGNDEDVPAAHTIYGRDFARIRSLDQFADTVGTLIQNQIRSL